MSRPDVVEAAREAARTPGAPAITELADALCLSRAAAAIRDHGGYGPGAPPPSGRAAGAHRAALQLLAERGLLRRTPSGLAATAALGRPLPYAELLVERADTVALDPIGFRWLCRALDHLPAVLSGSLVAEEVLFPDGEPALAEAVYCDSATFGGFARAALAALRALDPERVLELGAGGGAFASRALAAGGRLGRYVITDVAPRLVRRAGQRLGADGRAEVAEADLDRADGWPAGPFDTIVLLNALHLSRAADRALVHLRGRLAPHGVLILGEVSDPGCAFPAVELTFGLLPSFWPGGPGVRPLRTADEWVRLARDAGFDRVEVVPVPAEGPGFGAVVLCSGGPR